MTGAMYAAIGGLKSHMSKLNVIGNNTANVNTYGYKAQRMTFQESMYTTSRAGSNGGATAGGNNPSQIGFGCSIGSIDLNMSPSTYAPTGVGLDTYIAGEGFFMVGDKSGNILSADGVESLDLTRVGDFWIDPDGYVCNRQGKVLYGFATVQNPDYDPNVQKPDEKDPDYEEKLAEWELAQKKTIVSAQLVPLRVPLSAAAPTVGNGGLVEKEDPNDPTKKIQSFNWEEGDPVYPYLTEQEVQGKKYLVNNFAPREGTATIPGGTGGNNPGGGGNTNTNLGLGNTSAIAGINTDPKSTSKEMLCQLKSVNVDKNGAIQGVAANGDTVVIGYIAIASVDSPDGVTHIDGPYYKAMGGAGSVRVSALGGVLEGKYLGNQVVDNTDPAKPITPDPRDYILNETKTETKNGGLEASSTDVAEEYTQLITTQRGFQANTRIVTVTDSMLEELVNMKR
ncbi:flagellar hook-basal body complex protein [bacterium 1xD42-67]|nr:flagellar hook-basal body complex protein [bacterium 1xD42-67]